MGSAGAELVKAISTPLGACVKGFPAAERLHPFERALLDLTIGLELYEKRLARLTSLRQSAVQVQTFPFHTIWKISTPSHGLLCLKMKPSSQLSIVLYTCRFASCMVHVMKRNAGELKMGALQVGKAYAARAGKAANKKEAEALGVEGFENVAAVYKKGATAVDGLKDMAKQLRRLPVVDLMLPTVSLRHCCYAHAVSFCTYLQ